MEATRVQRVGLQILRAYDKEAGSIVLNKLFYLVDIAYYRMFGTTMSGLAYVRQHNGPYSAKITAELDRLAGYEVTRQQKPSRGNSEWMKTAWSIGPEARFDPALKPEEDETIRQVIAKVKELDPRDIEKLAYQTEPMQKILRLEEEGRATCFDHPLTMSLVKPDPFMRDYLAFRTTPLSEEDEGYLRFLEQEWAGVDSILQG